jgi:hypothetical protein
MLAFLAAHNTLTLATEREGKPWANALFYANDGFSFYVVSDSTTRHTENLKHNQHVAATINQDHRDWRAIQGVQLEGVCEAMTSPFDSAHALVVYSAKFPFIADLLRAPRELGAAFAKARFYKITPTWIRLIDNTRGFGHKEEIRLIRGIVRSGQSQGSPFTQLDWVRRQFRDKLGFDPYPGTLNLHVQDRIALAAVRAQPPIVIEPGQAGYCAAHVYRARVNGQVTAAWIIPVVPDYADDVVELMASVSLRGALNLKDGDSVEIEFGN